jgi:hypothetical protein
MQFGEAMGLQCPDIFLVSGRGRRFKAQGGLTHPASYFASDATPSISISMAGFGSACTTQVVRAG